MKILRLQSSNIQRVTAVDITPDPALHIIKVGGKNSNGKSSALDTISIAMGGAALCPAEPIHGDETEGMARLDLGELIVTRRFKRDVIVAHGPAFIPEDKSVRPGVTGGVFDHVCDETCVRTFGPTASGLVVSNKDGAKYPTPQAILDRLKSDLTFDPHAFARASERDQNAILRRIAGIDTDKIDEARKMAVALRTDLNRQVKAKEALLAAMPQYAGVPVAEIGADEVNRTLAEAEALRKAANTAASEALVAAQVLRTLDEQRVALAAKCGALEAELAAVRGNLETVGTKIANQQPVVDALRATETGAVAAVPDVVAIQTKLRDIEDTNKKVRANVARTAVVTDLSRVTEGASKQDALVTACDTEKAALLAAAVFPVQGLGLTEDGVTFEGKPFAQAGSANQLRASVSIGMALNPALRVLRIDNGNMLDEDSMRLLEEMAELHDFQIWCEWVTSDPSTVTIYIEDGHVA